MVIIVNLYQNHYIINIMKSYRASLIIIVLLFTFFDVFAFENEYLKKGLEYYSKREFELASAHFKEAKNIEPKNPLIYFYLGNSYYQLNDFDNAILTYTTGLNYTDEKGKFFYNLGNCYYLKENYGFSTEMYSKAVFSDPALVDSYLNSGNAYYKSGNYTSTIVQWETYLEKYPETPQYVKIKTAIAYLKEEVNKPESEQDNIDEKTGLDLDLLNELLSDLDDLVNNTENIMEMSENPVDDLSVEDIER